MRFNKIIGQLTLDSAKFGPATNSRRKSGEVVAEKEFHSRGWHSWHPFEFLAHFLYYLFLSH